MYDVSQILDFDGGKSPVCWLVHRHYFT